MTIDCDPNTNPAANLVARILGAHGIDVSLEGRMPNADAVEAAEAFMKKSASNMLSIVDGRLRHIARDEHTPAMDKVGLRSAIAELTPLGQEVVLNECVRKVLGG